MPSGDGGSSAQQMHNPVTKVRNPTHHNNNNNTNGGATGGVTSHQAAILDNNNNNSAVNADQQSFMTGTGEHNVM